MPPDRLKGRGTTWQQPGRFESTHVDAAALADEGWDVDPEAPAPRTVVVDERARSIISRNSSPDVPFDASINPYRGCEHGLTAW